MRILLKLTLDCDADAAWRALHSPRVVAELYGPFVGLTPMGAGGLPTVLEPGTGNGDTAISSLRFRFAPPPSGYASDELNPLTNQSVHSVGADHIAHRSASDDSSIASGYPVNASVVHALK